jgi:hypothetical protein
MPSILRLSEIPGREIDIGKQPDWKRRKHWTAYTDTRAYDEGLVYLACVAFPGSTVPTPYFSTHPGDSRFLCKRVTCRQDSKAAYLWRLTADYDTLPWEDDDEEDPLDRRAKISWSTVKYQKAVEKDRNGKAILNSAGDFFDPPPLKDVSRWTARVSKHLPAVPTAILSYPDKLNNADWTIQTLTVPRNAAKIMAIEISDLQKEGDVEFYTLTYTVEFDADDLWKGKYLNQGYYFRDPEETDPELQRKRCKVKGKDCASPQLLKSNGDQELDPKPSTSTFQEYDIENEMDFGVLPVT